MPGLGKASKTSVYEYSLSRGREWFPTIGFFCSSNIKNGKETKYLTPTSVISQIQYDLWIHII